MGINRDKAAVRKSEAASLLVIDAAVNALKAFTLSFAPSRRFTRQIKTAKTVNLLGCQEQHGEKQPTWRWDN